MIHPDPAERARGHARLETLAAAASRSVDPTHHALHRHTRSGRSMAVAPGKRRSRRLVGPASRRWKSQSRSPTVIDVDLGIEPELANVVNSAEKARKLIDQIGSSRLKVVLDPANLFEAETLDDQRRIVAAAIDRLADRIVMAHAKDRRPDGEFTTAGKGVLDYRHYLTRLKSCGLRRADRDPRACRGGSARRRRLFCAASATPPASRLRGESGPGFFVHDGVALNVADSGGSGLPVIMQHGLCGDAAQMTEVFPDDPRFRRMTLECRGHGASEAGDPAEFLDRDIRFGPCGAHRVGAGSRPCRPGRRLDGRGDRSAGSRSGGRTLFAASSSRARHGSPAAAPDNMKPNAEVGRLLGAYPADEARRLFLAGETARRLAEDAPDNLVSLTGFFSREPLAVTAALLRAIASDGPGVSEAEVARDRRADPDHRNEAGRHPSSCPRRNSCFAHPRIVAWSRSRPNRRIGPDMSETFAPRSLASWENFA